MAHRPGRRRYLSQANESAIRVLNQVPISAKLSPFQPVEAAELAATGTMAGPVVPVAGLVHAGLYWNTAVSHEAWRHRDGREAGRVGHRRRVGRAAGQDAADRIGADLGFLIGDVAGLGLGRRAGVADDVDLAGAGDRAGVAQHVDAGKAAFGGVVQACRGDQGAGTLARDHVDDVAVEYRACGGLKGHRVGIDLGDFGVGVVLDHGAVQIDERAGEVVHLGHDAGVGIEHEQLGAGFVDLEPVGDQAGALVRAGRAAVGRLGNGQYDVVIQPRCHGLQLAGQQRGLRAGLPGVGHLVGAAQARHGVEADAGRHDDAIGLEDGSVCERDGDIHRVDRDDFAKHGGDAVLAAQGVVVVGQAAQCALAAQHQAAHDVRGVGGHALDQGHADRITPQAQVLGHGGAAHAAANHDHA